MVVALARGVGQALWPLNTKSLNPAPARAPWLTQMATLRARWSCTVAPAPMRPTSSSASCSPRSSSGRPLPSGRLPSRRGSRQLVDYHVPKLVASGQLLLQAGRYRPQACLTDKNLFRLMKSSLIRQQLIEQVAAGLDFSQAEKDEGAVIEENILSLLRLFTVELKGGR